MGKREFLARLREILQGLPRQEIDERLCFYSEMIDDRMEEGLSEAEAVAAVGSVDEICTQILQDIPLAAIAKERMCPKRQLGAWEIVLLVLSFPLWFSLIVTAFAVVFSLYISLWAVVISLWAVSASFVGCAFGGIIAAIVFMCSGNVATGVVMLGAGLLLAGLSIFAFFGCNAASKGTVLLTKKILLGIKNRFIRKETAQ